jgi:hypothetical protein
MEIDHTIVEWYVTTPIPPAIEFSETWFETVRNDPNYQSTVDDFVVLVGR